MARGQPFRTTRSVTLDAAGDGEVTYSPNGSVDQWIDGASVSVSTHTARPRADVYLNGTWLENTYSGHNDTSDTKVRMTPTDQYRVVWDGGDAGARATLTVWGRQYPLGQSPDQ